MNMRVKDMILFLMALCTQLSVVASFVGAPSNTLTSNRRAFRPLMQASNTRDNDLKSEAAKLLEKARQLRESLPEEPTEREATTTTTHTNKDQQQVPSSRWSVPESDEPGVGYRLYIDIGREEGTWMDPRWGASGKRIEFTLDVKFLSSRQANQTVVDRMVKDNFGGASSPVYELETAPVARLRSGFDEMSCHGGGYRIDTARNGAGTARFHVLVDGTPESGASYGDIFVPRGSLYFSLPCFGGGVSQLSSKEGPLTVRQIGWHTGWRREESRMVGTFRAVPIEQAQKRDGF